MTRVDWFFFYFDHTQILSESVTYRVCYLVKTLLDAYLINWFVGKGLMVDPVNNWHCHCCVVSRNEIKNE